MTPRLASITTATPSHTMAQDDLASVAARLCDYTAAQEQRMRLLYERSTIHRRAGAAFPADQDTADGPMLYTEHAGPGDRGPGTAQRLDLYGPLAARLGAGVAREALRISETQASAIRHVVCATCTGFTAPGLDVELIGALGLSPDVSRTCIGFMGCHGAFNALRVATDMVRADPTAPALVCAVELCTLHFFYGWDPQKILANALFADGAAAAVVSPSASECAGWRLAGFGSCVLPDTRRAMTWRVGNHGFEMTLSPAVPGLISEHLGPWVARWLAAHGLSTERIGSWAIHPGGPKILTAVGESLGLDDGALEASRAILREHGNMSSPTILFILDRLRKTGAASPTVAIGFGPGLAIEAALLL